MIGKAHFDIKNPNSSGQGHCDAHTLGVYSEYLRTRGWAYSHTVLITKQDGSKYPLHCFKLGDWNISYIPDWSNFKAYSSRSGSGRQIVIESIRFLPYIIAKTHAVRKEIAKKMKPIVTPCGETTVS